MIFLLQNFLWARFFVVIVFSLATNVWRKCILSSPTLRSWKGNQDIKVYILRKVVPICKLEFQPRYILSWIFCGFYNTGYFLWEAISQVPICLDFCLWNLKEVNDRLPTSSSWRARARPSILKQERRTWRTPLPQTWVLKPETRDLKTVEATTLDWPRPFEGPACTTFLAPQQDPLQSVLALRGRTCLLSLSGYKERQPRISMASGDKKSTGHSSQAETRAAARCLGLWGRGFRGSSAPALSTP